MNQQDLAREKIKKHLKKHGDKKDISISPKMVKYWWKLLNVAVFYGKLHYPEKIILKKFRDTWGWCESTSKPTKVQLGIHATFTTKRFFLTVLVHEMVHAWEQQHHNRMTHGKRFYEWEPRIKRLTGLELKDTYNEKLYTRYNTINGY